MFPTKFIISAGILCLISSAPLLAQNQSNNFHQKTANITCPNGKMVHPGQDIKQVQKTCNNANYQTGQSSKYSWSETKTIINKYPFTTWLYLFNPKDKKLTKPIRKTTEKIVKQDKNYAVLLKFKQGYLIIIKHNSYHTNQLNICGKNIHIGMKQISLKKLCQHPYSIYQEKAKKTVKSKITIVSFSGGKLKNSPTLQLKFVNDILVSKIKH